MAAATTDQIKTRIETLADAVVTTLLTGAEYAVARSTLPAVQARPRNATNEKHGAFGRLETRRWDLFLFVSEIVNPENDADVNSALEACHPYLNSNSMVDYFLARPQLQDANQANPLVYGTGVMEDSGPATTPFKNGTYSAVRYSFDVTTMRP
jgi:hypothetical protein